MSGSKPGADELRMRGILRKRGVGYDAGPPAAPPALPAGYEPAPAADDWWNDLYDEDDPGPVDEEEPAAKDSAPSRPGWWQTQPDYYPRPHMPAVLTRTRDRADAALSPKTRAALYNASAAGAGWMLGLYQQCAHALADCGQQYSTSGALTLGIGTCLLIAHIWDRRTRHWWPGIAWVARIPLATALTALALWAPASA
jgi:hypothetical protein